MKRFLCNYLRQNYALPFLILITLIIRLLRNIISKMLSIVTSRHQPENEQSEKICTFLPLFDFSDLILFPVDASRPWTSVRKRQIFLDGGERNFPYHIASLFLEKGLCNFSKFVRKKHIVCYYDFSFLWNSSYLLTFLLPFRITAGWTCSFLRWEFFSAILNSLTLLSTFFALFAFLTSTVPINHKFSTTTTCIS